VLKDLKMSTRQRLIGIDLGFPPPDVERKVLRQETGLDGPLLDDIIIIKLGEAIRRLDDVGYEKPPPPARW
jgi:nitric oxide reductase NorQ protein